MKEGTLGLRHLKRAVLKNIVRSKDKIIIGSGVGNDYSLSKDGIVTADGFGYSPEIAFVKAYNNFICSLAVPNMARVNIILPTNTKESDISKCMMSLHKICKEYNVDIVGGNTSLSEAVKKPLYTVTIIGNALDSFRENCKAATVGDDIVFVGYAGAYGTNSLLAKAELNEIFSERFIKEAEFLSEDLVVNLPIDDNTKKDIRYIHDVSTSGVYGSLWQLGEHINKGILIDNSMIPIRQQTIEVCEHLDVNPYLIDGTGGMLVVAKAGERLAYELNDKGINASVIGYVSDDKERRIIISENDIRTLSPED